MIPNKPSRKSRPDDLGPFLFSSRLTTSDPEIVLPGEANRFDQKIKTFSSDVWVKPI